MSSNPNLLSVPSPVNHSVDSLFNLVLHEVSHGPVRYDRDRLESLLFNPIDRPELGNMLSSNCNKSKVTHANTNPVWPTHHACAQPFHPVN